MRSALGARPRLVPAVVYGYLAYSFLVELLGAVVKANHYLMNTAVFFHMAPAPAIGPDWTSAAATSSAPERRLPRRRGLDPWRLPKRCVPLMMRGGTRHGMQAGDIMDLTTRYMGLELRNPIVASAGPFARTSTGVRRLADAGVGAVVLSSLFEEQLEHEAERAEDEARSRADGAAADTADDYEPPGGQRRGPSDYLELIRYSVAAVDVPVIASLNGCTTGGWTDYAAAMEQAGASAIELNLYFPQADPLTPGREVEQRHVEVLTTVKAAVSIPVAVKITPYLSSPGELALRLDHVGADGLVLFNRFMQPGIDPETLKVDSVFELSRSADAAFPRMWIARLRGRVNASLAASTGVEEAADVAAYLLAGADVVMTTSSLVRHGPEHAEKLLYGLTGWMRRKGFGSLDGVRGLLAEPVARHDVERDTEGRGREDYLTALQRATARYSPDT